MSTRSRSARTQGPAMRLKKPAVSNLGAASLAKAPVPAALESALVLGDQIRQEHPQGQRAAQVVEESAFGQIAPIPLVARVQTQRKRRALSKLTVTPLATPLGGLVPTGPIFIPADQIRQKQSQSRQESVMERGASGPSAIVPLTAELLTQRWIPARPASPHRRQTRASPRSPHSSPTPARASYPR
jgi:hypothetical protein